MKFHSFAVIISTGSNAAIWFPSLPLFLTPSLSLSPSYSLTLSLSHSLTLSPSNSRTLSRSHEGLNHARIITCLMVEYRIEYRNIFDGQTQDRMPFEGARPVHLIITMITWIWTSRLSIKALSRPLPQLEPLEPDHGGGYRGT